jgi:carbon-monoxide dehydrogenase medium subunit
VPATTLSHHLAKLTAAGLVSQERQARMVVCRANLGLLHDVLSYLYQRTGLATPPGDVGELSVERLHTLVRTAIAPKRPVPTSGGGTMYPQSFEYLAPTSLAEAIRLLKQHGDDAKILSGGHSLVPLMKLRLATPAVLVDVGRLRDLSYVRDAGDHVAIGALTRHRDLEVSDLLGAECGPLRAVAAEVGDNQVRHRGTIGGSVANNDPAADYPAALLGLGASVVTNRGQYDADSFFTGLFSTALQPGEIITAVHFPIPDRAGYAKFEQRASRYCLVSVFVAQKSGGIFSSGETRVAVSGAGQGGVFRVTEMEQALKGNFSPSGVSGIKVSPANLMSDMHGGAEYRAALITVMAERAVEAANA